MKNKLDRLNCLIGYLIFIGKLSVLSIQKEIIAKTNKNKTSVSMALNGDERYLTDKFIERVNSAFGSLFNNEWLTKGEGKPLNLSIHQEHHSGYGDIVEGDKFNGDKVAGSKFAHLDKEEIKTLQDSIECFQKMTNYFQKIISEYHKTIAEKDAIIAKKDEQINELIHKIIH
ncbi:MAG: hypothetical protein LBG15_08100 [Dysgonamonadaceae bacterium]|jgi:hypothetical protein|nr:hypothetical protein [Dysgonamonadaceae bacterium]